MGKARHDVEPVTDHLPRQWLRAYWPALPVGLVLFGGGIAALVLGHDTGAPGAAIGAACLLIALRNWIWRMRAGRRVRA
ncbi:MAG TPA: hypothetical protein VIZ43_04120 [Trebonia sp.]